MKPTSTGRPKHPGPLGGWREHAVGIVSVIFRRWQMLPMLGCMVAGAAMVSGAAGFFFDTRHNSELDQGLTGRVPGRVESAWWRLDLSPDELDGASNWAIFVDPSFCVRTRQSDGQDHSQPKAQLQAAVSCLRYQRVLDIFDAPFQLQFLGGEQRGIWLNETGQLEMAFHLPDAAWNYLSRTPTPYQDYQSPWRPYAGLPPDGQASYWEALRVDFEQPADHLLTLYQSPLMLDLAVDPEDPTRAAPAFFLDQNDYVDITPFVAAVGVFGVVFWAMSFNMLLGATSRMLRVIVVTLSLASVPWWGNWVWRGLDLMLADASNIGQMLQGMFVQRPPTLALRAPDYRGEAGDQVERYSLSNSLYGAAFDGINLTVPAEPLTLPAAKALIQSQIDQSLMQMTPAARTGHFEKLACLSSNGFRGAGDLFLGSAEQWADDPESGQMAAKFIAYQNDNGIQFNSLRCDR